MKHCLFLVVGIFFVNIAFSQGIESGLLAKYCFSGNANDGAGTKHATVYGATLTADRFGVPNEAYTFDGVNDYIQMPSDTWITGDFSFSGWIYLNATGYWDRFFEFGNGFDLQNLFYSPDYNYSKTGVLGIHNCTTGSLKDYAISPTIFPLKVWTHIAITLKTDTVKVYKDNTLWHTYKIAYKPCPGIKTQCYFGKSNFAADTYLDGKIDDVRFYDRVISVAEIDTLYHLTGCTCPAPVLASPHDTTVCKGALLTLNATGANTYRWSGSPGLSDTTIANPALTANAAGVYIVKGTATGGCVSYDTVKVHISAGTVTAKPHDTSVCDGAKFTLGASGSAAYSWVPSPDLTSTVIPNPVLTVNGSNIYIVKGTDPTGCDDYDTVRVTALPAPVISATPNDTLVCLTATITLKATGGSTYLWSPSTGLSNPNIANPILTVSGNASYIVKGTDANGCTGYDTISVQLGPGASILVVPHDTSVCAGDIIQLSASGGISYKWFPPTGLSSDVIRNPLLTVTEGAQKYKVRGTDIHGCTNEDSVTVNGYPVPDVTATAEEHIVTCSHRQVRLHASGAQNYEWSPAVYCDDDKSASPLVNPPHDIVFTVKGTDLNGCKGMDTVFIKYLPNTIVKVANAFTPNDDGINDIITPIIICDFVLKEFAIYNRWGQNIFKTSDAATGWDGRYNGVPLDMGVYYYYIKGKNQLDEDEVLKGDIMLIR